MSYTETTDIAEVFKALEDGKRVEAWSLRDGWEKSCIYIHASGNLHWAHEDEPVPIRKNNKFRIYDKEPGYADVPVETEGPWLVVRHKNMACSCYLTSAASRKDFMGYVFGDSGHPHADPMLHSVPTIKKPSGDIIFATAVRFKTGGE